MSGTIATGDFLSLAPEQIGTGDAALVFADPPFNIGYKYDVYSDRRTRADYLAWADRWLSEAVRCLAADGSLFLAIGDEFVAEYKLKLDALGLTMRNWIVWHYAFGPHQKRKFGRDHAHVLYYVRNPDRYTFNADAVRVVSRRQLSGDKRADPRGRVPGDVWSFPRLPGNAKERTGHPCQMPESILDRVVRVASNPGDLVVDPFCGSGTTAAVAAKLGRRWWTCDVSDDYAAAARGRVLAAHATAESGATSPNLR